MKTCGLPDGRVVTPPMSPFPLVHTRMRHILNPDDARMFASTTRSRRARMQGGRQSGKTPGLPGMATTLPEVRMQDDKGLSKFASMILERRGMTRPQDRGNVVTPEQVKRLNELFASQRIKERADAGGWRPYKGPGR